MTSKVFIDGNSPRNSTAPSLIDLAGLVATKEDVFLSYLPLAHVFERTCCYVLLCRECAVSKNSIRRLIRVAIGIGIGFFGGNIATVADDMSLSNSQNFRFSLILPTVEALRPTLLTGVPRVLSRIRERILDSVQQRNFLVRKIFDAGYRTKKRLLQKKGIYKCPFFE